MSLTQRFNPIISAIQAIFLMVVIICIIGISVAYYVNVWAEEKYAVIDVSFEVESYSLDGRNLYVMFNVSNVADKETEMHIEATVYKLVVDNRTVVDKVASAVAIAKVRLWDMSKDGLYQFRFNNLIGVSLYIVEMQLVSKAAVVDLEQILVLERLDI